MRDRINAVTLGGGSGQSTLLSALRQLPFVHLAAIVTPFDSWGSSRLLRDQYDVLPYGDIQRCVFALSPYEHVRDIFSRRLELPGIEAPYHTCGNLLLPASNRTSVSVAMPCRRLDVLLFWRWRSVS